MNNFNQFANFQPQQHPISAQAQFSNSPPATSSVQFETTLSPTQLNTSGPGAFNYPFCNQPYMVPMGPVYPQVISVPGASNMTPPLTNLTPPLIVFQSPSPLPHFNSYYPQQQGYTTPIAVGQINGQFFPVPFEGMQLIETQSQNSSGSSEQTSRTTPPQQPAQPLVQPPSPPANRSVRPPPPGFTNKSHSPQRRKKTQSPISWSQRVIRKKPVSKSTPAPKRQTSRVKKESSRKVTKTEGRKKRTKFGYRSKQNKIDTVHENLERRYAARGILAEKETVLRGSDVLRLHVKKFDALTKIELVLEAAEKLPGVTLSSVSIPLSMKNEFQKKGFLVYCQLSDVEHVEKVKQFFQSFPEFSKCQIAMPNLGGNEGEPEYHTSAVGEPIMAPVETGSPELTPMQKIGHVTPLLDGEKDNFTLDEEADLALGILPMLKNVSLASATGC